MNKEEKNEALKGTAAEQDVNRLILRHLRALGRNIRALSEGRASQKRILRLILEEGGITQFDLTQRIGVKPGSASEVLGKLESAGLIVRAKNGSDKRTYDISLTEKGRTEAEKVQRETVRRRADMFSSLSEEEKEMLLKLLDKLSSDWKARYENRGE